MDIAYFSPSPSLLPISSSHIFFPPLLNAINANALKRNRGGEKKNEKKASVWRMKKKNEKDINKQLITDDTSECQSLTEEVEFRESSRARTNCFCLFISFVRKRVSQKTSGCSTCSHLLCFESI